ncbi:MAG: lysostaphin resistance A-like protein [Beijerinckiaceae bacterium]
MKKLFERDESAVALRFGRWGFWWTLLATVASLVFAAFSIGFLMGAVEKLAGLLSDERWSTLRSEKAAIFLGNPYSLRGFIAVGVLGICATCAAAKMQGVLWHGFLTLYGGFSWKRFWRMGSLWFLVSIPITAFSVVVYGKDLVWSFAATRFPLFIMTTLAWIALQTFAEEAFFRGYLYHAWVRVFPYPVLVTVVWSALFAALHWTNVDVQSDPLPAMIDMMTFAFFAQWLTVRTGSLDAAWGMHFTNNVFAFLAINVRPGYNTDAAIFQYTDLLLITGGSYANDPLYIVMQIASFALTFWAVLDRRSPFFIEERNASMNSLQDSGN